MTWLLEHQHVLASVIAVSGAALAASFFALWFKQPVKETNNERT